VDLARPLAGLDDVTAYEHVRVLFFWSGVPIASADVDNHGHPISVARLLDLAVECCSASIVERLFDSDAPARADAAAGPDVAVSVVVATLDRPAELRSCLAALQAQATRRPLEIAVVDNHPASGLTAPIVKEFPGVVLLSEPRRGQAYARNAGFLAARGAIVACADDGVVVPAAWVESLAEPFADPTVMAVTGNVLPLELESAAQRFFEASGCLGHGFARRALDGRWFRECRTAMPTWTLGVTACAAFRAAIFRDPAIGLMDEALGSGLPSSAAEDAYLFYKILKAGHRIVYEPSAYVWHRHPRSMPQLRRQMYRRSTGHVAYHLTTLLRHRDRRALGPLAQLPRWHARQLLRWMWNRLRGRPFYPLSLLLLQIGGHLAGPWNLWRSRRRVAHERRTHPPAAG
jgi:cellulose synthase/poly-beta-1,6-N-acetylglucosamine synthase-like glycosyltransferase